MLFRRVIEVTVAGLFITQPRIRAVVEREAGESQTKGAVQIYNLSPGHSEQIYERAEAISLQAGYPSTIASIFEGNVQRVRRPRQNLAHITHIELGDMTHSPDTLGGSTNRTYEGLETYRNIVADFIFDMGLAMGPLTVIDIGLSVRDYTWSGRSTDGLTNLLGRIGIKWFEDDGVIRFQRGNFPQPDAPVISISPASGLVGTVAPTDEGVEAKMFLNPQVRIGNVIDLFSRDLPGRYRVVGLKHEADNWKGPFTTWVDLREL